MARIQMMTEVSISRAHMKRSGSSSTALRCGAHCAALAQLATRTQTASLSSQMLAWTESEATEKG